MGALLVLLAFAVATRRILRHARRVRARRLERLVVYRVSLLSKYTKTLLFERDAAAKRDAALLEALLRKYAHLASNITADVAANLADELVRELAAVGAFELPRSPAAQRIQAVARGNLVRNLVRSQAIELVRSSAARRIQAVARGNLVRAQTRELLADRRKSLRTSLVALFMPAQRKADQPSRALKRVRTGIGRSFVQQRLEMLHAQASEGGGIAAAAKIEEIEERYRAQQEAEEEAERQSRRAQAATVIGARYRKFAVVKQIVKQVDHHAAADVQRVVRGYLARRVQSASVAEPNAGIDLTLSGPCDTVCVIPAGTGRGCGRGCWRAWQRLHVWRRSWQARPSPSAEERRVVQAEEGEASTTAEAAESIRRQKEMAREQARLEKAEEEARHTQRRNELLRAIAEVALERAETASSHGLGLGPDLGRGIERAGTASSLARTSQRGPGAQLAAGPPDSATVDDAAMDQVLQELLLSVDTWAIMADKKSVSSTHALQLLDSELQRRGQQLPTHSSSSTHLALRLRARGDRGQWEAMAERPIEWLISGEWHGVARFMQRRASPTTTIIKTSSSSSSTEPDQVQIDVDPSRTDPWNSSDLEVRARARLALLVELVDQAIVEEPQPTIAPVEAGACISDDVLSCISIGESNGNDTKAATAPTSPRLSIQAASRPSSRLSGVCRASVPQVAGATQLISDPPPVIMQQSSAHTEQGAGVLRAAQLISDPPPVLGQPTSAAQCTMHAPLTPQGRRRFLKIRKIRPVRDPDHIDQAIMAGRGRAKLAEMREQKQMMMGAFITQTDERSERRKEKPETPPSELQRTPRSPEQEIHRSSAEAHSIDDAIDASHQQKIPILDMSHQHHVSEDASSQRSHEALTTAQAEGQTEAAERWRPSTVARVKGQGTHTGAHTHTRTQGLLLQKHAPSFSVDPELLRVLLLSSPSTKSNPGLDRWRQARRYA